jgi:hypothetical protein
VFKKIYIKLAQWRNWRRRRRRRLVVIRPKIGRTCITTLWCHVHDHLAKLFIIRRELLVFFSEMSCVLLQGHELRRLGARYWLRAPNGWDTTGHPQVLGRSVGEPIHPIFIGSTRRSYLHPQIRIEIRMGRRIVSISLPQLAIIGLLKMKKEIIIFNSIKIITYEIKWLNEHTTKCWTRLSMNCCVPFRRSWLRTCVSTNSSIGLGSRPRDIACKEK